MAIGAPAEQAIEIFNKLVRMVPAEAEDIGRIEWRLRALARSRPKDTATGVGLLLAQLMLGKGQEAVQQADRLWLLRRVMLGEQLGTFVSELLHLGMYERAAQILHEIQDQPTEETIPNLIAAYLRVAWDAGSLDDLQAIAASPVGLQVLAGWKSFLERIKIEGLGAHLAARQEIVRSETIGQQCFAELILTPDDDEALQLTHYVYLNADYDKRTKIEETIRSRLDDYFTAVGIENGNHWDLMTEVLVPVTAGPSWHKDSMLRAS